MTNKLAKLTRILFNITAILTLLLILICISDNEKLIQKFLTIYGISFLLFLISILITTFIQLKSLSRIEFKDRIIRFMKFFTCSFLILSLLSIIFKPNSHDIFNNLALSLGAAFGSNFLDLLILKKD